MTTAEWASVRSSLGAAVRSSLRRQDMGNKRQVKYRVAQVSSRKAITVWIMMGTQVNARVRR